MSVHPVDTGHDCTAVATWQSLQVFNIFSIYSIMMVSKRYCINAQMRCPTKHAIMVTSDGATAFPSRSDLPPLVPATFRCIAGIRNRSRPCAHPSRAHSAQCVQLGLCKWPDGTTSAQPLLLFCTIACDAHLAVTSQPAPACRTVEASELPI